MNPIEVILAQLMGGGNQDAGRFAAPDLMNGGQSEADARALIDRIGAPRNGESGSSVLEEGNNSPHMILRRLLTGSNADPVDGPPPEFPAPPRKQSVPSNPRPAVPMPQGVAPGSMPTPSDPSRLAMVSNGQQRPTSSPMPPQRQPMPSPAPRAARGTAPQPMSAPSAVAPAQAAPSPAQGGLPGMLAGFQKNPTANLIRDLLTSAMAGAATAQGPRAGNIGALGVGYTTAEQQMRARQKEQAAAELAKQKLGFDQTLATRKDGREERGANREDEKLGISRADQKRKDAESKVRNQVAVEKLMKVRDDGSLPLAAKIKIQDQLNQYADKVNKNGLMSQAELDGALTKERSRLEQYYGLTKPASDAAPAAGGPTDGTIAVNPTTGQRLIRQGGQWVPAP